MEQKDMSRRKKRKRFRIVLNRMFWVLLILVSLSLFVYSGYHLWQYYAEYRKEEMLQQELSKLRTEGVSKLLESETNEGTEMDNGAQDTELKERTPEEIAAFYRVMKKRNEDYVCWLTVEGTSIDYPVVQRDNVFYLSRDFEGEKSRHGSIFLDETCDPGRDVLLLHGHHMKDGTMFGELKKYKDDDFRAQHELISLEFEDGVRTYRIFAVAQIDLMNEESFRFENIPETEEEKVLYIEGLDNASFWYDDEETVDEKVQDARLVILSTCDYGTEEERLLVAAREIVSP